MYLLISERENYRKIQKDEYEGASDSEDNDDDDLGENGNTIEIGTGNSKKKQCC